MSMAARGEKWWLQIHLSTAVIMMIAAGGLMWANLVEQIERDEVGNGRGCAGRDE